MAKITLYGNDARKKLLEGVEFLAKAVSSSLGPAGRNTVIFNRHGGAILTKDGVTIAESISAEDLSIDAGVQLVKQVARKTADTAGDGTTTATILAHAIYRSGMDAITKSTNPILIKRGLDKAVAAVCGPGNLLDQVSRPVVGDGIVQVGTIAANNDPEIGGIIAQALRSAGANGVVTVEDSKTFETTLEHVEGMEIGSGYVSPYFVNDHDRQECIFDNAYILICDQKLNKMGQLQNLLEMVQRTGRPLLIIGDSIEGDLLALLVVNRMHNNLNVCAIKAPGVGPMRKDFLLDLAALTGGKAIIQEIGMAIEKVTLADLGQAEKLVIKKERTVVSGGKGSKEAIDARIHSIQTQINATEDPYARDRMQERLSKLSGGVSIIKLGASSEVELIEKKARAEDAIHATRAALEEGIVPGGGQTLANIYNPLMEIMQSPNDMTVDEATGFLAVCGAILAPRRFIIENSGGDVGKILCEKSANNPSLGYDALKGEWCNLLERGIIDPTKVVRMALMNAASVAGSMLLCECLVVDDVKEQDKGIKLPRRK